MSWAKKQWKKSAARKELERIRKANQSAATEKYIKENTKTWFDEKTQLWWHKSPFYRERLASKKEIDAALRAADGGE